MSTIHDPHHPAGPGGLGELPDMGSPDFWTDPSAAAPAEFGAGITTIRAAATPPPLTQALYLQQAGDTAPISLNDLHQGQLGDWFLISPIGEIALHDPNAIKNMIHVNANGTETVTLYTGANGRLPTLGTTQFRPYQVTIANTFPRFSVNNGATQDVVGGQKEIWPQVLEKAVATLDGSYTAIAYGGYPTIAMEELTGKAATAISSYGLTLSELQGFINAGDLITMDTPGRSNLPDNLVGGHSYMFEKLTMSGSTPMVQLGNPWGTDQPSLIPLSRLSAGIAQVDIGKVA